MDLSEALRPGDNELVIEAINDQSRAGLLVVGFAKSGRTSGVKLDGKSEVNANPKDTKDHPFGVWTLPPVRQSSPNAQTPVAADFDRAKYDAIGESDRMTLKFVKPKK